MKPTQAKLRNLEPVTRLAKATAACSVPAQAYGACILASYESVERGMCETEFRRFKDCVQEKMKRKW